MAAANYEDPLDTARLRAELADADRLWRAVEVVPATGSTNADLVARAQAGEPAGLVLATDHQVAGRGRLGRTWTAPAGTAIAMSVLLRPERDPAAWTWLPLLAGLAVADSLRADELPVPTATSLAVLRPGERFVRVELMATVLAALALLYHRWEDGRDAELASEYVARCDTLGRAVRVLDADSSTVDGEAIGVDPEGRLRVRTATGIAVFAAGDVTHLR